MGFKNRPQYKKGTIAEEIVSEWIRKNKWKLYQPSFDGSHPVDKVVWDNEKFFIADTKGKSKRRAYEDTGIDLADYEHYSKLAEQHRMRCFIFFVDEILMEIYGNWLDVLDRQTFVDHDYRGVLEYPQHGKDRFGTPIIYFPLVNMERGIGYISKADAIRMSELTQSSYATYAE